MISVWDSMRGENEQKEANFYNLEIYSLKAAFIINKHNQLKNLLTNSIN